MKYEDVHIFGRNIKFLFNDRQWLLLRLSGTEPAFRIFAEFEDEEVCEKLTKESKKYIDEVQTLLIKEK